MITTLPDFAVLCLAIAIGSAIGGVARLAVSTWVDGRYGSTFPWGTLAVNVTGAGAIGMAAALASATGSPFLDQYWALLVIGLLGSYTTVSTFALQTVEIARTSWMRALANVLGSAGFCMLAAVLGFAAMRLLTSFGSG